MTFPKSIYWISWGEKTAKVIGSPKNVHARENSQAKLLSKPSEERYRYMSITCTDQDWEIRGLQKSVFAHCANLYDLEILVSYLLNISK